MNASRDGDTHRTLYLLREAERLLVPEHLELPDHVLLLEDHEREAALEAVRDGRDPPLDLRALVAERRSERLPEEAQRGEPAPAAKKTIGGPPAEPEAEEDTAPAPRRKTIGNEEPQEHEAQERHPTHWIAIAGVLATLAGALLWWLSSG